jgi:tetratricopeptide (TPR) repeat protein
MFNCSNCGHQIDDARVPLPPFCPRCGEATGGEDSPFGDDGVSAMSPLPPPPPMGAPLPPLPPPPPMGGMDDLPPPPRSGRGEPSKTLFGMQGLSFDNGFADDGGLAFPTDDDDDDTESVAGVEDDDDVEELEDAEAFVELEEDAADADELAFPTDDDSGAEFATENLSHTPDGNFAFPTDDDEDDAFAPLTKAPPARAPEPPAARPPARPAARPATPPPGPPPRTAKLPPPPVPGLQPASPARAPAHATKPAMRPPPIGAKSPPIPPSPKPPLYPAVKPTAVPPPPIDDPFSSGILPLDSGVMSADSGVTPAASGELSAESGLMSEHSGTFDDEDDPFFAGRSDQLPELGSITYGDASQFAEENPSARSGVQEFEFQGDSGPIELGELGPVSGADVQPPVEHTLGRTSFDQTDFAGLDLPSASSSGVTEMVGMVDDGFDLPMPTGTARDIELPPSRGFGPELDLPEARGAAPDLDLPNGPGVGPGVGSGIGSGIDLPEPRGVAPRYDLPAGESELELPLPADDMGFDGSLSLDDLPMPSPDLPMPVDNLPGELDDFQAPLDDFPAPDLDGFDSLPTAVDSLPTPVESLPTAASSQAAAGRYAPKPGRFVPKPGGPGAKSTSSLPASVDDLDLDLDSGRPAAGGLRGLSEQPIASPIPDATSKPARQPGSARLPRRRLELKVNRYVIYGGLGLALLVGGGLVAMQMGLFDPATDDPQIDQGDGGGDPTPQSSEPTERPESVLAKFDQDTPASYVQAYEVSEADPVARAEAALLLHYRYGPDPAHLAEAGQLLAAYQTRPEPFVRRVVGLALLISDQHDQALAMLDDDGSRSSLYRAWVLLDQGEIDQARTAAEAAVAARPNDQAAQLAVLQARFAANPIDGIAAMRQAAKASPNHLALQEALMRAAHDQGRLDEAAKIGQAIQPSSISDAHKAELLRQRAGVAMAQGRTGVAMRLLDQALASDAGLIAARVDRINLWLSNKDFSSVRAELDVLLHDDADHPSDPLVIKTAVRADLEAGLDEEARARLEALGEAGSKDPEIQDLFGQAHALVMKIDEARTAFAAARKLDPLYTASVSHEVDLLVRAELRDDASKLLDEQLAALVEAGAKTSIRGRRALATVGRIQAEILLGDGELERALTVTEEAIASDPASNDAMLLRARLLAQLDKRQAHEEALLELHERTGGYPGLTEPLGKVLLRKGKLDELEALISDSLEAPEASREIILTGAALRLAQDRPEQAQSLAQKILERDPTDTRAHLLLGRALLVQGQYARALSEIESARTREGDAEVELWLGQALEYNARPNDARAHYTRALELDPNNLEAAALLGRLYAYEGAAAKAIELLAPVVQETDAYPYAYLALGLAHKDMGKRDLAITDFQKAQQLDASLFEAFYQEGRIHNDLNKHGPAAKALQAALDNAKANATERALIDTYRRLGESYLELGRRAEARAALEEYMKLAPANAAGRREVERLLSGL